VLWGTTGYLTAGEPTLAIL